MTVSASEPSKTFWVVGIATSLAVHAGLIGAAALLAGRYARASAPTEITFSNEASPVAEAVPATAAAATLGEVASAVPAERVEPSPTAEAAAEKAETVQPAEAIAATEAEPAATSENTEAAAASQDVEGAAAAESAERAEVSSSPDAAAAVSGETAERLTAQEQPAAAIVADPASAETSVGEAAAESAPPIAAQDVASAGSDQAEQVVALQTPERIVAAPASGEEAAAAIGSETATSPAASNPEVASASSTAETVQTQAPATDGGAVASPGAAETAALASPSETVAATEAAQPSSGSAVSAGSDAAIVSGGQETAETAAPASPSETVAATEAVQPSNGNVESAGSDAVVPGGQETAETLRPVETALLVPARPNSVLGTEIDKPTDRYRRIVDFIRGYRGGDCFIALPAMDLAGNVTFQTFGRDKAREDEFREALGAIDELRTEVSSGDVADPQCLALAFAQAAQRYPGFSLVIDLNETEMASGTRLSGKVLNATGRDVHLLLVDDEGTVQSMDSFLSAEEGGDRSFSVPLTLTGGPVATKQILMAIATDPPIWGLDKVKQPAAEFFRELATQVEASRADLDLAVEGFNVR